MPFDFSSIKDDNFTEVLKKSPHLLDYMEKYTERGNPLPLFTEQLRPEHKKTQRTKSDLSNIRAGLHSH